MKYPYQILIFFMKYPYQLLGITLDSCNLYFKDKQDTFY